HRVELGARRIGPLSVPPSTAFLATTADAYGAWCTEHDQEPIVELLDLEELDRDQGGGMARAVERLVDRTDVPDAVYAPLEIVGIDVHRLLRAMELRTPDDRLPPTAH